MLIFGVYPCLGRFLFLLPDVYCSKSKICELKRLNKHLVSRPYGEGNIEPCKCGSWRIEKSYDFIWFYVISCISMWRLKRLASNKWIYWQALLEKRAARELQEPVASQRSLIHRENGGALGMVPWKQSTPYTPYKVGISLWLIEFQMHSKENSSSFQPHHMNFVSFRVFLVVARI